MAYNQYLSMKKEFRIPMVPGSTCGEELMRRNYHRGQIHGEKYDTKTTIKDAPRDQNAGETSQRGVTTGSCAYGTNENLTETYNPANAGENLSGRVLRFYGYTVEQVPESAIETSRIRKVVMQYFLEDGTMSVTEPKQDNSGIPFSASLKRHIVPHPDGTPIVYTSLKIGEPITFYGRTYLVYDADEFTRSFFKECGAELPPAIAVPMDQYNTIRSRPVAKAHDVRSIAATSALNIMLSPEQVRATQRFLEHDREVLRCDCTWDDTEALNGSVHYLTLYYFISDGSIAVVEKDFPNSGRDDFPVFIRRQRIAIPTDPHGKFDSSTLGSVTFKETQNTPYYTDEHIRIGNALYLYGRKILIHEYDKYTRDYLAKKFGITEYKPLPGAAVPDALPMGSVRREKTSEELEETVQRKVMELRRHKYNNTTVKFQMKLDNGTYEDEIRRFVLAVYLADNTISIYEPVIRNSGIVGGKFLQRQRVRNTQTGAFFTSEDFYVGANVKINNFPFIVLASDEHSLKYMETNMEEFSRSDINRIVQKIQAMLRSKHTGLAQAFREADDANTTGLDLATFISIFQKRNLDMSEQEIMTILRYFDKNNESYVSYEEVAGRVLPEGTALASDNRSWEEIYKESLLQETATFLVDEEEIKGRELKARISSEAAKAAKIFLELFDQRRELFLKEFRSVTDFAKDSLIGRDEFIMCVRRKLQLDAISEDELNALCTKLFPPGRARLPIEEMIRLFKGTSTLPQNLCQIRDGKCAH